MKKYVYNLAEEYCLIMVKNYINCKRVVNILRCYTKSKVFLLKSPKAATN